MSPTFLHCFPANPARTKRKQPLPTRWWAVHVETLTPIRISLAKGTLATLDVILDPAAESLPVNSHPEAEANPIAIANALIDDLKDGIHPACSLHALRTVTTAASAALKSLPPEHMIVFDIRGDHPALWRTADPRVIYPVVLESVCGFPAEILAGKALSYRSAIDLPAAGWTYYWDECQDALEALSPALAQAANS